VLAARAGELLDAGAVQIGYDERAGRIESNLTATGLALLDFIEYAIAWEAVNLPGHCAGDGRVALMLIGDPNTMSAMRLLAQGPLPGRTIAHRPATPGGEWHAALKTLAEYRLVLAQRKGGERSYVLAPAARTLAALPILALAAQRRRPPTHAPARLLESLRQLAPAVRVPARLRGDFCLCLPGAPSLCLSASRGRIQARPHVGASGLAGFAIADFSVWLRVLLGESWLAGVKASGDLPALTTIITRLAHSIHEPEALC